MIIVRLLSPSLPGWFWHHQVYSGLGAGIVMESIIAFVSIIGLSVPGIGAIEQQAGYLKGPYYLVRHGTYAFGTSPNLATAAISEVPHWSGSFSFSGISYAFNMVGTSPFATSITTTIPTV